MTTDLRPAVFWDLGGVILRTADHRRRRAWEARLGLPDGDLARLVFDGPVSRQAMLGQASVDEVWISVGRRLGLTPDDLGRLRHEFFADDHIDDDLMTFIRGLRRRARVGLISNAWAEVRQLLASPWSIADAFDPLVLSAEVGLVKPDARIFHLALNRAEVEAAQAVFVDDLAENVDAALAAGMRGVLFHTPDQARQEVESHLDDFERAIKGA